VITSRPDLPRRLLAEFLGTALLVTAVVGSGIMAVQLSPGQVGLQLLENSIATMLALTVLILVLGPVSDALGRRRPLLAGTALHVLASLLVLVAPNLASWLDLRTVLVAWKDTIRIIRDFPLTGTGLNTYGTAMTVYQSAIRGDPRSRAQMRVTPDVLLNMPRHHCLASWIIDGSRAPAFVGRTYAMPHDTPETWAELHLSAQRRRILDA